MSVKIDKKKGGGEFTGTDHRSCPICRSDNVRLLFRNYDTMFGYPGWFHLDRCGECGHVFLRETFTPEMLTDLYSQYYLRSQFDLEKYEPYKETGGFLAWLDGDNAYCHRWVPPHSRVLDIGCGHCESLGYHQKRGCEVYGCEADDNTQKIAAKYGFNVFNGLFDDAPYEENFFDYVTMNWVLEHCNDPEKTLRKVCTVLKPGGQLIFSIPNLPCISRYFFGRFWFQWQTPFHLHLFSETSARMLLERCGFQRVQSQCLSTSLFLIGQWGNLFTHGSYGKRATITAARPNEKFGEKEKLWYVRFYRFLEKLRFHAWLERFADRIGMGETRLYFA
ncbi:MAG: class I SAM-dependent methyltransferase, partial [Planctomycetaceae bacterium]|nr:class I SAM-dependent methyltransferase [Planctomycetaceae bacterium]